MRSRQAPNGRIRPESLHGPCKVKTIYKIARSSIGNFTHSLVRIHQNVAPQSAETRTKRASMQFAKISQPVVREANIFPNPWRGFYTFGGLTGLSWRLRWWTLGDRSPSGRNTLPPVPQARCHYDDDSEIIVEVIRHILRFIFNGTRARFEMITSSPDVKNKLNSNSFLNIAYTN